MKTSTAAPVSYPTPAQVADASEWGYALPTLEQISELRAKAEVVGDRLTLAAITHSLAGRTTHLMALAMCF